MENGVKKYDISAFGVTAPIFKQNHMAHYLPQLENKPSVKDATWKLQSYRQEWFLAQKNMRKLKEDAAIWIGP